MSFYFSAIKYEIPSEHIPSDQYKCTHHECDWRFYEKGTDWDFYQINGRNISGCRDCMAQCDEDPNCKSLECGEDLSLPDGTTVHAYCSWWNAQSCYKHEEFTLNPNNYIWTCLKKVLFFNNVNLFINESNLTSSID